MNADRKTAIAVGALYLISYAGVFAGSALVEPLLSGPDVLANVYPQRTQLVVGVLVELINAAAVLGIGALLFPVLKGYGEGLALTYAGVRVVEAVASVLVSVSVLPLIDLSREYIAGGALEAASLQAAGAFALAQRHWASDVLLLVFFALGALILYALLYRSRLLPRFIPVWGIVAVVMVVAGNLLPVPDMTEGFHPAQLLFFPIILNELFLAVWLIVKGFRSPESTPTRVRAAVA
jgi:hypothetical protein